MPREYFGCWNRTFGDLSNTERPPQSKRAAVKERCRDSPAIESCMIDGKRPRHLRPAPLSPALPLTAGGGDVQVRLRGVSSIISTRLEI